MTLAAAAATLCALLLLAWRDPARIKAATKGDPSGNTRRSWTSRQRLILAVFAVAPGIALAVSGAWAHFAMWLGLLSLAGWLTARVAAT